MSIFKHSLKFVLQQTAKPNKLTPLRCFVRFNNARTVFASGISIEPRYWNKNAQEPRQSSAFAAQHQKISDSLQFVKSAVETAFDYLTSKYQEYPTPDALRDLILEVIKNKGELPGSDRKTSDLLLYMANFIGDAKSGNRLTKRGNGKYSAGTLRGYGTVLKIVTNFAAHKNLTSLKFGDLDADFYNDFKKYCYQIAKVNDNYFGTIIKFIKTAMAAAESEGLHNNQKYKAFVKLAVDVDNVYLNGEQLAKMLEYDFSDNPRLEKARDLFLVGCWTGLRFSDFTTIKASNIGERHINIKMQKTKKPVAVPISQELRTIMKRYEGKTPNSLPPALSNVKLNLYIKEVAKAVGLDEMVELERSKAGLTIHEHKPLHELISTHTARRSFASNMFHLGVPTLAITKITGHRTESSFMKYIKASPTEMADIVLDMLNSRTKMKVVNES